MEPALTSLLQQGGTKGLAPEGGLRSLTKLSLASLFFFNFGGIDAVYTVKVACVDFDFGNKEIRRTTNV